MEVSATEQDCIYCIIFQIKLHICHMLGRPVHNAPPSIQDSPIILYPIMFSLYANVIHLVVVRNAVAMHHTNTHA
jgi:hypothetical protein